MSKAHDRGDSLAGSAFAVWIDTATKSSTDVLAKIVRAVLVKAMLVRAMLVRAMAVRAMAVWAMEL